MLDLQVVKQKDSSDQQEEIREIVTVFCILGNSVLVANLPGEQAKTNGRGAIRVELWSRTEGIMKPEAKSCGGMFQPFQPLHRLSSSLQDLNIQLPSFIRCMLTLTIVASSTIDWAWTSEGSNGFKICDGITTQLGTLQTSKEQIQSHQGMTRQNSVCFLKLYTLNLYGSDTIYDSQGKVHNFTSPPSPVLMMTSSSSDRRF